MRQTSRYVTSCVFTLGLAVGAFGCGGSAQSKCVPAVSADVAAGAHAAANATAQAGATADAVANASADAALKEAAELRARAEAHLDAGRFREALPDLERAFALSGDVTMLGDLGLALQAAGRLDEAWVALVRFRAEARAAYEPVRANIDAKLGELEKQLGGLVIDTDTPGAEVVVRGQVVARLPMATPIYLAPGDATVIVRAPGKPDFAVRAKVATGAIARASANLAGPAVGAVGAVGGTVGGAVSGLGGALGRPTGAVGGAVGGLAGGLGRPTGAVGGAVGGLTGGLGRPTGSVDAPSVGGVDAPAVGAVGGVGAPAVGAVGAVGAPAIGAVGGIAGAVTPPAPPVWPIVVGVGGVVVVGGAIAASVVHSGRLDTFDANLCGKSGATPECPAIESGLKVTTGLQVAGYLVGGIALTAGVVAFAVTRSATAAVDCPNEGKAAPLMVRCGVSAGGQGAGVGCFGAF